MTMLCSLCRGPEFVVKLAFHDADIDTDTDTDSPNTAIILRPTHAISSPGSSWGSPCRRRGMPALRHWQLFGMHRPWSQKVKGQGHRVEDTVFDVVCSRVTRRSGWMPTAMAQRTRSTPEHSPRTSSVWASLTPPSQSTNCFIELYRDHYSPESYSLLLIYSVYRWPAPHALGENPIDVGYGCR